MIRKYYLVMLLILTINNFKPTKCRNLQQTPQRRESDIFHISALGAPANSSFTRTDRNQRSTHDGTPRFLSTLGSIFGNVRNLAGQALMSYNFYAPEIKFTKCVGNYMVHNYPEMASSKSVENTTRLLKTILGQLVSSFRTWYQELTKRLADTFGRTTETFTAYGPVSAKVAQITQSDLKIGNDHLQSTQNQYDQTVLSTQNLPATHFDLNFTQNKGYSVPNLQLEDKSYSNVGHARKTRQYKPFRPVKESLDQENTKQEAQREESSIFDFDEILAQHLGINAEDKEDDQVESLSSCTQSYTLDIMWRASEKLLLSTTVA